MGTMYRLFGIGKPTIDDIIAERQKTALEHKIGEKAKTIAEVLGDSHGEEVYKYDDDSSTQFGSGGQTTDEKDTLIRISFDGRKGTLNITSGGKPVFSADVRKVYINRHRLDRLGLEFNTTGYIPSEEYGPLRFHWETRLDILYEKALSISQNHNADDLKAAYGV